VLNITISGLNYDSNQHANWLNNQLKEGDKISIEIISDDFDPPTSIRQSNSEKDLLAKKLYEKTKGAI